MGRASYIHTFPLLVLLMAVALIGLSVVKFLFVAVVTIGAGAVLLYAFLAFMHSVDLVIDYFYEAR